MQFFLNKNYFLAPFLLKQFFLKWLLLLSRSYIKIFFRCLLSLFFSDKFVASLSFFICWLFSPMPVCPCWFRQCSTIGQQNSIPEIISNLKCKIFWWQEWIYGLIIFNVHQRINVISNIFSPVFRFDKRNCIKRSVKNRINLGNSGKK